MASSKGIVAIGLISMVLVFAIFVQEAGAEYIGNPALGKGAAPGCGPLHPEMCRDKPGNEYQRGCEKENRCRGEAGAEYIGNPALGRGAAPGCGPLHPEMCRDKPGNEYQRGCEKENRCRGG
ncbi:protein RALF-like 9 [Tripterygium wilfordii]|uniref:Protein RALF-like 9 n=1 Tax=Tripterygium wilfordii TaxID=458696 RepID=A0A7J7DI01_TRIWF|nr:protein RALF-like 9 [Tripterygium wilfordii]